MKWLSCLLFAGCAHASAGVAPTHVAATASEVAMWSDSTSQAPEAQIYRLWQTYYKSKRHSLTDYANTPSEFWIAEEQRRWPGYDIAGNYQPRDGIAEIESIKRVSDAPARYEIAVYFATHDSGVSPSRKPVAINFTRLTFAAVERDGRWMLANVLPYRAQTWDRHTVGAITFFIDPKLKFSQRRAELAAAFVDSLSNAFHVPQLTRLDYYSASSVDAAYALFGVEYGTEFGSHGGFDQTLNHQTFSGDPFWGENYRHELVHHTLFPLAVDAWSYIASEGMATWLGGTGRMNFRDAVKKFDKFFSKHPGFTIDSAMLAVVDQQARYVSSAVLCEMIWERGGLPAIKQFVNVPPGTAQSLETLQLIFGKSWEQINIDWRAEIKRIAKNRARTQQS